MTTFAWGALFGVVVAVAGCLIIGGQFVMALIAALAAGGVAYLAHRGGHV